MNNGPSNGPSNNLKQIDFIEKIKSETNIDLKNLKENIEASKVKKILDLLEQNKNNLSDGDKAGILASILGSLNNKSLSITISSKNSIKIENHGNFNGNDIETVINDFLNRGIINVNQINTGLMYKTSSLDNYIKDHKNIDDIKPSGYFIYLIKKYNLKGKHFISIKGVNNPDNINNLILKISKEDYKMMKISLFNHITDNIGDREYIINYLETTRKGVKQNKNSIKEYKNNIDNKEKELFKAINDIPEEVLTNLGVRSNNLKKDLSRKFVKDPLGLFADTINKGGAMGLIIGLLAAIMGGGWKGFFAGFVGGSAVGAYGLDGINTIKDNINNKKTVSKTIDKIKPKYKDTYKLLKTKCPNINEKEFDNIYLKLSESGIFKGLNITELEQAINNNKLLDFFDEKASTLGTKFYTKNKQSLNIFLPELLKLKETNDKKIGDLFTKTNNNVSTSNVTTGSAINNGSNQNTNSVPTKIDIHKDTVKHYTIKDGKLFLVGQDGTSTLVENKEFSKEMLDQIKKIEKVAILKEIIDIWRSEANSVAESIYGKMFRDDDDIIKNKSKIVNSKFGSLLELLTQNKLDNSTINKYIDDIFNQMQIAEEQEDIIGSSDLEIVKEILNSNKDKQTKLIYIYDQMKYGGLSGNSKDIKEKVAKHILQQKDFKDINDILNNDKIIGYISNNNLTELEKTLGSKYKEFAPELIKAYNKIKVKNEKLRDQYAKQLIEINKTLKQNGKKEILIDDYINSNVQFSMLTLLKHKLIEYKVSEKEYRGGTRESYVGLYANITGYDSRKGIGDYIIIGDDNIDLAIEIGGDLALAAATMGVGFLAAKTALTAAKWGARLSKLNKVSKFGKFGTIAAFTGESSIEGIAFYESSNLLNTIIYGNSIDDIGKGSLDTKEIAKSIAFMGVLKYVSKYATQDGTAIKKLSDKVPNGILKKSGAILLEAGLLTGTSLGIELMFEGEGEWSWEEYIQAIVMVGMFKLAGKITLSKGKGNNIDIKIEEIKNDRIRTLTTENNTISQDISSIKNQIRTISRYPNNVSININGKNYQKTKAIELLEKELRLKREILFENNIELNNLNNGNSNISSVPIEFYKNDKGNIYTKTLDGKFYNKDGVELKRIPKNIQKIEILNIKGLEELKILDAKLQKTLIHELKTSKEGKIDSIKGINIEKTSNGEFIVEIGGTKKIYSSPENLIKENYSKIDIKSKFDSIQPDILKQINGTEITISGVKYKRIVNSSGEIELYNTKGKLITGRKLESLKKIYEKQIIIEAEKLSKEKITEMLSRKIGDVIPDKVKNSIITKYGIEKWNKIKEWPLSKIIQIKDFTVKTGKGTIEGLKKGWNIVTWGKNGWVSFGTPVIMNLYNPEDRVEIQNNPLSWSGGLLRTFLEMKFIGLIPTIILENTYFDDSNEDNK